MCRPFFGMVLVRAARAMVAGEELALTYSSSAQALRHWGITDA